MARRRRLEAIDDEFQLPQPIIQHIQSFLDSKQAARTTLLSKSWHNAWLIRPTLDFDDKRFKDRGLDEFWDSVKKTIERYEKLNLKISSLRLWMTRLPCSSDLFPLATDVVLKAIRMGVEDIDFSGPASHDYVFPFEVLQTENLVRLSLRSVTIKIPPGAKVTCSRVKSLCLDLVTGRDDFDLLSGVLPLFENLENLTLAHIFHIKPVIYPTVKTLCVRGIDTDTLFSCAFPCVEELTLTNCHYKYELREDHFSNAFGCVKNLTIDNCYCNRGLRISSRLLKYITLVQVRSSRLLKFDVPNIRRFKFSGNYYPSKLPTLSFATVPAELECDVSLHIQGLCSTDLWCYRLQRFMRKLNMSKVSLAVQFDSNVSYRSSGELKSKPGPVVDNLRLLNPLPFSAISDLLASLLWIFRPKVITGYWFPTSPDGYLGTSYQCIKLLSNGLIEGHKDPSADGLILFGNHDLGGVNDACSNGTLAEWFPLPLKMLSDTESPKGKQETGFKLEWRRK